MKYHIIFLVCLSFMAGANSFAARSGGSFIRGEENFMVANGQGISSPSFWNGLEGENPAGMAYNQTVKLQIGAGSYEENGLIGTSTTNTNAKYTYGSGALIMGNGILGAGVEYQNFNNYFGSGSNQGRINWGLAGRLQPVSTTFGLSSHTTLNGVGTTYDAGILFEPFHKMRMGFMIPDFTRKMNTFAGGVTFFLEDSVSLVVDADYSSNFSLGVVKPGVTFSTERVQASVAYGVRYLGESNAILYQGFGAGLGIKLADSLLITYEYRGVPEHRLGLTLRFN